ncbi:MAG: hypothetical protein BVN34_05660 [Proteobacteria bacterium ST_bin12]|nr:MAG: hypothetical protein BVN34_05660 [Proteobacteria bacterium ST_bin12]
MTSNTLLIVGITAIIIFGVVSALRNVYLDWLKKWQTMKLEALNTELEQLCKEISIYPTPTLTAEHIPQRFPSKEDAEAFGQRWSYGGETAYRAKAVDNKDYDEDHPKFDKASIAGGILYTHPALFFGVKEAHRDDDDWFIDFTLAKNRWLKDYLSDLRGNQRGK